MTDLDIRQIEAWAAAETEEGTELSAYRHYAGMGVDPQTGDLVDYSGEWRVRDVELMLETDGIARAAEQALTLPLRGAPLAVKPDDGDRGEAELVNETFAQLADPVEELIGQAAQSLVYRATFIEKIWAVRDGRQVYDRLAWRPPDSCGPTRDPATGELTGFRQQMAWWGGRTQPGGGKPTYVNIPLSKACVFVHGKEQNPTRGVSELQTAYRCFVDKQKIRYLWMTFLKGAAISRVIAKTQSGSEGPVAQTLAKLSSGGVAAVANVDDITVLEATDSGAFFKEALAYLDNEMLSSILAGFLGLTGAASTGRGSFALSKDQSDFFTQSQDASAREIAATIRAQLVRPLVVVNFGPNAVVPKVTLGPIARATAQEQMDLLKGLAAAPSGTILPREFVDELTQQIAGYLDLDTDKVAAALKAAAEAAQAAGPVAGTTPEAAAAHGVIGAATGIVARGQAGAAPLPAA